ncbi:MAG: exo-alpha-sialidase [Candidatus Eisenbacteria bacterium]
MRVTVLTLLLAAAAVGPRPSEPPTTNPPITTLASPARPGSGEAFLAAGPAGSIALTWFEVRPRGGHRLRYATRAGSHWSAATTIAEGDSFFVNWADFPSVVVLEDGTLAAHWLWKAGAGTYAYHVRLAFSRDRGRTWSRPIVPHRDGTPTEHGFVSLVAAGDRVRAVWLDGRNTGGEPPGPMTLRTALVAPDGTMSDEWELDDRVCDCCQTATARTRRGLVVAYRDRSDEEIRDIAVVRQVEGRWSAPVLVPGDRWKFPGCPVNGPSLAAAGDRVVLAWFTAARDSPQVKVAVSNDGGASFEPGVRVDRGAALGRVDVTMIEGGAALVSWLERDGGRATLRHRVIPARGTWPPDRVVAAMTSGRAGGFPQVIVDGRRVVFAWTDAGKPSRVRLGSYRLGDRPLDH